MRPHDSGRPGSVVVGRVSPLGRNPRHYSQSNADHRQHCHHVIVCVHFDLPIWLLRSSDFHWAELISECLHWIGRHPEIASMFPPSDSSSESRNVSSNLSVFCFLRKKKSLTSNWHLHKAKSVERRSVFEEHSKRTQTQIREGRKCSPLMGDLDTEKDEATCLSIATSSVSESANEWMKSAH